MPKSIDIYFRGSSDGGYKFGDTKRIINSTSHPLMQTFQVATSGKYIYVIWAMQNAKGNIGSMFMRSADNGTTFDRPINLSKNSGENNSTFPSAISVSDNKVYIVLDNYIFKNNTLAQSELLFERSTDNGLSFSDTVRLSGSSPLAYPKEILNNQLVASGKNVYVAWIKYDDTLHNSTLFLTKSNDNGSSFDTSKSIATNLDYMKLATSGNNLYVLLEVPVPNIEDNTTHSSPGMDGYNLSKHRLCKDSSH